MIEIVQAAEWKAVGRPRKMATQGAVSAVRNIAADRTLIIRIPLGKALDSEIRETRRDLKRAATELGLRIRVQVHNGQLQARII